MNIQQQTTTLRQMNMQRLEAADRKLSDQLSQIQEDRDSEPQQHRPCVSPPVLPHQSQRSDTDDPAMLALYEQQRKLEDNKCLLQELARIEQELRESLGREVERQRQLDDTRKEENRVRWRSLCYLSLNQRITKPFVTSYYRNFPMHIYCLPIQSEEHKQNKKKKKRKR